MMIQIVSVFDQALQSYSRPVFVASTGVAIRSFQDEVNRPDSEIRKHPKDYVLYHLGEFDDELGQFYPIDPSQLVTAVQLVKE